MKDFIHIMVIVLFVAVAIFLGYWIHHSVLPKMGATMITPRDIIACYSVPIVLLGIIGYFLGGYWTSKLR